MHLADVRHIDQRIDAQVTYSGAGFLGGFTNGRLFDGLAVLHETGRQGPETTARFDGAATEQHLGAQGGNAASDDIGVLIVNGLTFVADIPQARIAFGNALSDRVTAVAAKIHAGSSEKAAPILAWCGVGRQVVV